MYTLYYLIFVAVGAKLAYWYGRKTKVFLWREYAALMAAPVIGVLGLTYFFGMKPIYLFFLGMLVLPTLELLVGRAYYGVLGKHLWVYERYPLPGRHTSWLTLPIWGAGMVLLWLISKHL